MKSFLRVGVVKSILAGIEIIDADESFGRFRRAIVAHIFAPEFAPGLIDGNDCAVAVENRDLCDQRIENGAIDVFAIAQRKCFFAACHAR